MQEIAHAAISLSGQEIAQETTGYPQAFPSPAKKAARHPGFVSKFNFHAKPHLDCDELCNSLFSND